MDSNCSCMPCGSVVCLSDSKSVSVYRANRQWNGLYSRPLRCYALALSPPHCMVIATPWTPPINVKGSCRSRNFRQFEHRVTVFTANSECTWWSRFSIAVYGSKTVFSLPFVKYCSNLQTISEKKFGLGPQ